MGYFDTSILTEKENLVKNEIIKSCGEQNQVAWNKELIRRQPHLSSDIDIKKIKNEFFRMSICSNDKVSEFECLKDYEAKDHIDWYNDVAKSNRSLWDRYKEYLRREQKLSSLAISNIDSSTDQVMSLIENPCTNRKWFRKGLVFGDIQSGKTSNYIGLINKAADAGFKIIIILAGMYNNLRAQTQIRVEEGCIGYQLIPSDNKQSPVGVRNIGKTKLQPNIYTTRCDDGDFISKVSKHIFSTQEENPIVFVVKKNTTILSSLYNYLKNCQIIESKEGEETSQIPLIIVDDEADSASIDTKKGSLMENGKSNKEHNPTTINRKIRAILKLFDKKVYVGYTATPFANILIPNNIDNTKWGDDLFPSNFIINLESTPNYFGPKKIFGLDNEEDCNELIMEVDDVSCVKKNNWIFQSKKVPLSKQQLPISLQKAIKTFFISTAIRSLRNSNLLFSSMLIHVTRLTREQSLIKNAVELYVKSLSNRIRMGISIESIKDDFFHIWDDDFNMITKSMQFKFLNEHFNNFTFEEVWCNLEEICKNDYKKFKVLEINGTSDDVLSYEKNRKHGRNVIVIGGEKLARGLTLEGLSVSYFLRTTQMYDTLMQMGRWFGYRDGYQDLCRIYTSKKLLKFFKNITQANYDLRSQISLMNIDGFTPTDFGLSIQYNPGQLVTSKAKQRNAKKIAFSYSGSFHQITSIIQGPSCFVESNLNETKKFISLMGKPEINPIRKFTNRENKWEGAYWQNVSSELIINYLEAFTTIDTATVMNLKLIVPYIKRINSLFKLLEKWNVALIGKNNLVSGDYEYEFSPELKIHPLARYSKNGESLDNIRQVKDIYSARDLILDLDDASWKEAMEISKKKAPDKVITIPTFFSIIEVKSKKLNTTVGNPMLLIYPIDPKKKSTDKDRDNTLPLIGLAILIPSLGLKEVKQYIINAVKIKEVEGKE